MSGWGRVPRIAIALCVLIGLSVVPQELPELHPQSLVLTPASPVEHGRTLRVTSQLVNSGRGLSGELGVEFAVRLKDDPRWMSFASDVVAGGLTMGERADVHGELDTNELEPGRYEVRVRVDPSNTISESDESNNELISSFRIDPSRLGLPDLLPTELELLGASGEDLDFPIRRGDILTLTAEVFNVGEGPSGSFDVSFFRRRLDREDETLIDTVTVASGLLPNQGHTTDALSVTMDTNELDGFGVYEITARVDPTEEGLPGGSVKEANEANNAISVQFTLQGVDLRPTSIVFTPARVDQGETTLVSAVIAQSGVAVLEEYAVDFLVAGRRFATQSVSPAPDSATTRTVSAKLDTVHLGPGAHEVVVVVDPEQQIPELDEANNRLHVTLILEQPQPQLPELRPDALRFNPSSPAEESTDDRLILQTDISNTGLAKAAPFDVHFFYRQVERVRWIPMRCIANCTIRGLEPDGTIDAKAEIALTDLQPLAYQFRVEVDPDNRVAELDEANNTLQAHYTLRAARAPDLISGTEVRFDPASRLINRGEALDVSLDVCNEGDAPAGPFAVEFRQRRETDSEWGLFPPTGRQELDGLDISSCETVEVTLQSRFLRPGSYATSIVIDAENDVDEQHEDNNRIVFDVDTAPLFIGGPELLLLDPMFTPTFRPDDNMRRVVGQGEPLTFAVDVTNPGQVDAGDFEVHVAVQDEQNPGAPPRPAGTFSISGLGQGVKKTLSGFIETSHLPPGPYTIRIEADPPTAERPYGQVEEIDEGNNENNALWFRVVLLPDYALDELALDPTGPLTQGQPLRVTSVVRNLGQAAAAQSAETLLEIRSSGEGDQDGFEPKEIRRLHPIDPGSAVPSEWELDTSELDPGSYELRLTVDPFDRIDELDEINNVRTVTIEILPPPDLLPVDLFFLPSGSVRQGEVVKVVADVLNRGPGPSGHPFRVRIDYRRHDDLPEASDFRELTTLTLSALAADEETAAKADLATETLPPGRYEVRVRVDPDNAIPEVNETNNDITDILEIQPRGDVNLQVREVTIDAYFVKVCQPVTVHALVVNSGDVRTGPFSIEARATPSSSGAGSSPAVTVVDVAGLDAGQTRTEHIVIDTCDLSAGNHDIRVTVDPDERIEETNESDNVWTGSHLLYVDP